MRCTICNIPITSEIYAYLINKHNNIHKLGYYCEKHGKLLSLFFKMKKSNVLSNKALRDRVLR